MEQNTVHSSEQANTTTPRPNSSPSKTNISIFVGGVAVGAILGSLTYAGLDNYNLINLTPNSNVQISSSTSSQILEMVKYQDGDYVGTASFVVPANGATHNVKIYIQVKEGKVATAKMAEILADGKESVSEYMEKFNTEISGLVQGKKIDDVPTMSLVSGSTLSSDAFKSALKQVADEAMSRAKASELYADGDYYGQAFYAVPALGEGKGHYIGLRLTVKAGVITNVVANEVEEDGTVVTNERFGNFDKEVEGKILGKTLDQARNQGTINGSSNTTQGLNSAIELIYQQASIN